MRKLWNTPGSFPLECQLDIAQFLGAIFLLQHALRNVLEIAEARCVDLGDEEYSAIRNARSNMEKANEILEAISQGGEE